MESYNNNDPDKNGLLRKGRLRDEESRFQTSLLAVLVSPLSLSSRYLSRREDLGGGTSTISSTVERNPPE